MKKQQKNGFCITSKKISYTGTHLLLRLWLAKFLSPLDIVKKSLMQAMAPCRATLLGTKLQHNDYTQFIRVRYTVNEIHGRAFALFGLVKNLNLNGGK